MRKIFNILISAILILAGMHAAIVLHFCEGNYSSAKFSLGGKTTSCCAFRSDSSHEHAAFSKACCNNEITISATDDHVLPDIVKKAPYQPFHVKLATAGLIAISLDSFRPASGISSGPPHFFTDPVNRASLCILRI